MNLKNILESIKFNKDGLIPAIVQEEGTTQVLMLAYMNEESLTKTLKTGKSWFYSRSKKRLWLKGETSGNTQKVKRIYLDCDNDALLILVEQKGVACHTGRYSCFFKSIENNQIKETREKEKFNYLSREKDIINEIYQVIQERKSNYQSNSYVCKLLTQPEDRLPKKIGEEATEVIIALKDKDKTSLIYEIADLWFHTLVALGYLDISPEEVFKELRKRRKLKNGG